MCKLRHKLKKKTKFYPNSLGHDKINLDISECIPTRLVDEEPRIIKYKGHKLFSKSEGNKQKNKRNVIMLK